MYPKCFDSQEQFDAWLEAANACNTKGSQKAYCRDCDRHYQWKMKRAKRCINPKFTAFDEAVDA